MFFTEKKSNEINNLEISRNKRSMSLIWWVRIFVGQGFSQQKVIVRAPRTEHPFYSNPTHKWLTAKSDRYLSSWGHADSKDTNFVSLKWCDCKLPVTPCNELSRFFWKDQRILRVIFSKCVKFSMNWTRATNRTWHP